MRWGWVVAVLTILAAGFALIFIGFIFETGGGRRSSADALWGLLLMAVVFGIIMHYGFKLAENVDRKSNKSTPPETVKTLSKEEVEIRLEKIKRDNKRADKIGCLIWIIVPIAAVIIKSILTGN